LFEEWQGTQTAPGSVDFEDVTPSRCTVYGSMAIPAEVDGTVRLVRRERPQADGAAHRWI
jgi:hypothetical protein